MIYKDVVRYFTPGMVLECTAHWRSDKMIGIRRVVDKIKRTKVELVADVSHPLWGDYTTPSDLDFTDMTRLERNGDSLRVEWLDGAAFVQYRVIGVS